MAFFLQHPELPFTMTVQLPISQTQNFAMLAIPLFIFAGNLMNSSGITKRLMKLAEVLTGHMHGGLAQVSVVLSTLMGGVSALRSPTLRWRSDPWSRHEQAGLCQRIYRQCDQLDFAYHRDNPPVWNNPLWNSR